MSDFDQAARYAVRHLGDDAGFFRWVFGARFALAWRYRTWLDTQAVPFPGEPDRRCDTVAGFDRSAGDQPPLAAIIEFMSRTRTVTLRRLAQYGLQVQQDCPHQTNPRVEVSFIAAVLNLTGGEQADELVVAPPDTGNLALRGRFKVLTLSTRSAANLLRQVRSRAISPVVLVWAPLMAGADTADFVRRWLQTVEQLAGQSIQGNLVALAKILSELAGRRELWTQGLEGFQVERSQVVMEWEQRGVQRGQREGLSRGLIAALKAHYRSEVPENLRRTLEAEQDQSRLLAWLTEVVTTTESLEALSRRLGWIS